MAHFKTLSLGQALEIKNKLRSDFKPSYKQYADKYNTTVYSIKLIEKMTRPDLLRSSYAVDTELKDKPYEKRTDIEFTVLHNTKCAKCKYGSRRICKDIPTSKTTCDYLLITGHPRGCDPFSCTKFSEIGAKTSPKFYNVSEEHVNNEIEAETSLRFYSISKEDATYIKNHVNNDMTFRELAEKFGVSKGTINKIRKASFDELKHATYYGTSIVESEE